MRDASGRGTPRRRCGRRCCSEGGVGLGTLLRDGRVDVAAVAIPIPVLMISDEQRRGQTLMLMICLSPALPLVLDVRTSIQAVLRQPQLLLLSTSNRFPIIPRGCKDSSPSYSTTSSAVA